MTSKVLREYLEIVVDMEKDIFLKERLEESLRRQINLLGQTRLYEVPQMETPPTLKSTPEMDKMSNWCMLLLIPLFILTWVLSHSFIAAIAVAFLFVVGISVYQNGVVKRQNETNRYNAEKIYAKKMERYEEMIKADQERIQEENNQKIYLEQERKKLQAELEKSRKLLIQFYDEGNVFPKYRNFVMIASIYEYICSGRCLSLEGADGAYNILEIEIRLDRIVTRLDVIIKQLNTISSNQYLLYSAINETNMKLSQLEESVTRIGDKMDEQYGVFETTSARIEKLEQNSELTAYYAERTHKELAYMNRMNYLTGRNDGVPSNIPPSF